MVSGRARKRLAIIETAAPGVYAGARQSSPPHCQEFPRPMGHGGPCCGLRMGRQPGPLIDLAKLPDDLPRIVGIL
jgi:hypothetical protein